MAIWILLAHVILSHRVLDYPVRMIIFLISLLAL